LNQPRSQFFPAQRRIEHNFRGRNIDALHAPGVIRATVAFKPAEELRSVEEPWVEILLQRVLSGRIPIVRELAGRLPDVPAENVPMTRPRFRLPLVPEQASHRMRRRVPYPLEIHVDRNRVNVALGLTGVERDSDNVPIGPVAYRIAVHAHNERLQRAVDPQTAHFRIIHHEFRSERFRCVVTDFDCPDLQIVRIRLVLREPQCVGRRVERRQIEVGERA